MNDFASLKNFKHCKKISIHERQKLRLRSSPASEQIAEYLELWGETKESPERIESGKSSCCE